MRFPTRLDAAIAAIAATAAMSFCTLATAADAPAGAAAAADGVGDMITVQTISAMSHRMPSADAATLAGAYPLSNGELLRVSFERNRLYADLGQRRTELVQTGRTNFVGRGTGMQFTFDQVPFATDVVITNR